VSTKRLQHQYYINAASHSGYFPEIITHAKSNSTENIIDTNLNNITDLVNFINHNLSDKLGRPYNILREIEWYIKYLTRDILLDDYHSNENETRIIYQFSLKVDLAMDKIWSKLTAKEKQMLSYIEKYFNRYLSGIPKENFIKLIDFWSQSNFKSYQIENLTAFRNGFQAKFKNIKKIANFDYVINCTGIEGIYNTSGNELVKNIHDHHQIKINSKHGLQINPFTCNVYFDNQSEMLYQNVFAIGEAKIGSGHLCCDYAYHARDAKKVVEKININLRDES
jgi:hypothetical protein